ncbi:hypothetical protein PVL29_005840 [Vitis rotundifolia]|uniref:Acyl-[acyl-carrier-protein] desaturase n=1 Tax=Vitis rotundifolia TaxID=103349 RepID=A0AA39DXZ7_VITRO|nr:hypothetical protein PVL29_005840 [Vitis rotundifolia]
MCMLCFGLIFLVSLIFSGKYLMHKSFPDPGCENLKKPFSPPWEVHVQATHSMPPPKQNILVHLKPVEKSWQPQDFLPDPASDGFHEQVKELRERARELPDDNFVVLVGDMITEEALLIYQTMLNTLDGVQDETGVSLISWAIWTRAWTIEENRHGDLLNKQIEKTIQYSIGSGMGPRTENSPYLGFIYTSFRERATLISHGNTARLAKEHGDIKLKRHETAYTKIVEKLSEFDPDGTILAFAYMMKKEVSTPAHLMYDGRDDNLFDHFLADYADILEFSLNRWNVEKLTGLSSD